MDDLRTKVALSPGQKLHAVHAKHFKPNGWVDQYPTWDDYDAAGQAAWELMASDFLNLIGGDGWKPTCATCKHWMFDRPDHEFADLRMGECKAIKQRESLWDDIDDAVRWTDEGEKLGRQAMLDAKAIAVDGSGYYAAVRTLGDFGCVKHEPASPPPPASS